ncbi:hypothetical protein RFF05_06355 [Bengtsoniella intestinalis]|uniref:hypothetical protein n=1 Tax=Bengtsoniella intestinalis TaxID=3073143 RepID=UPI00391F09C9
MRKFLFQLSTSFNPLRWCLFAVTIALVAVVEVYGYINLSASVAITFSSFETAFVILSDPMALAYIFLPLYLFLVCGLATHAPFGTLALLRYKSRRQWLCHKWGLLVVYTALFFGGLFAMVFTIASQAFPYQAVWSSDFILLQVSLGQEVANFIHSPLQTIGMSLLGAGLLYLFVGAVAMVCGLMRNSEPLALAVALVLGLVTAGVCNYLLFPQRSLVVQSQQALVFGLLYLLLMALSMAMVGKVDLQFAKKG